MSDRKVAPQGTTDKAKAGGLNRGMRESEDVTAIGEASPGGKRVVDQPCGAMTDRPWSKADFSRSFSHSNPPPPTKPPRPAQPTAPGALKGRPWSKGLTVHRDDSDAGFIEYRIDDRTGGEVARLSDGARSVGPVTLKADARLLALADKMAEAILAECVDTCCVEAHEKCEKYSADATKEGCCLWPARKALQEIIDAK
jgi:hypothetical protein